MPFLRLTIEQLDLLVKTATTALPNECCGLLLGKRNGGVVNEVIILPNVAQQPTTHFEIEPLALLKTFQRMERENLVWLGVFHSHPRTPPIPSSADIGMAEIHYPQVIQLIISLQHRQPRLKAWSITQDGVNDVPILVGNQQPEPFADIRLSRAQVLAIVLTTIFAVLLMISVSFNLLPPAPPLPTPLG
jgi:[CysO sulfur-carrier protein]-S-L-cysteine hydrolase